MATVASIKIEAVKGEVTLRERAEGYGIPANNLVVDGTAQHGGTISLSLGYQRDGELGILQGTEVSIYRGMTGDTEIASRGNTVSVGATRHRAGLLFLAADIMEALEAGQTFTQIVRSLGREVWDSEFQTMVAPVGSEAR